MQSIHHEVPVTAEEISDINTVVTHTFDDIIKWPKNAANKATSFLEKRGFPNAPNLHEEHECMVGNHSINVMMVCGPNHVFYAVYAYWPGSVHDARVLRNVRVFAKFEEGWTPFLGAVILGDSAYPRKEWLIPPLHKNPNDMTE